MNEIIIFGAKHLTLVMILISGIFFLKLSRQKQKEIVVFAIITLPAVYIVAKLASLLYFNPRPFVVENFIPLIPHADNNGFPSDHTLLSGAVAAIVYFFNKKLGIFLFALAFFVGFARVLVGVHHVIDIIGSIVIAAVISFLMYNFFLSYILKSIFYKKLQKFFE